MLTRSLRLLLFLKLRGKVRKQVRRLKTPKGIFLALVGATLVAAWFGSLAFSAAFEGDTFTGENLSLMVEVGALALCLMTITASLNHRGIYMPSEELELLLAAPVSRADLVRYRLIASVGRYLLSGMIFGLLFMLRLPHAGFAFFGILLSMLTLPILGQFTSLVAGALELRFGRLMRRSRLRYLHLLLVGLIAIGFVAVVFGDSFAFQFSSIEQIERLHETLRESPIVQTLVAPLTPWTTMIASKTAAQFYPWFGVCLLSWLVLFELTVRMPFDFRELTLETSADVARRIRRVQRTGFGASAGKASMASFGRRIPWLFGRSPAGAMAWVKLSSILRKTRGTVTISILIVSLMTVASLLLFSGDSPIEGLKGATIVALLGTVYLCAGLRFDFRTDLDQMEAIKSWPISSRRAFFANLLPEVLLVSSLISCAIVVRILVTGAFHPAMYGLFASLPLLTLGWVALDNAVFLFAPVRNVAGQEGMLQHMGRSMVLVFLRVILAVIVFGSAAALGGVAWALTDSFQEEFRFACAGSAAAFCLFVADIGLVFVGGWVLKRFDVSKIPN